MDRSNRFGLVGLILALLAAPLPALAQTPAGPPTTTITSQNAELAGKFVVDTAIPQAPGFSVIGLSPSNVVDPGASRVSVFSFANYLDADNNLKPGFALGGSPYWWFNHITLDGYRKGTTWAERALARTEVSLGFADGGAGKPDKLGLGFNVELLDNADYRLDTQLYDCTDQAIDIVARPVVERRGLTLNEANAKALAEWAAWKRGEAPLAAVTSPGEDLNRLEWIAARAADIARTETVTETKRSTELNGAGFEKAKKACRDAAVARYAQRRSLQIAGGMAARLVDGKPGKTAGDGGSVWLSYRQPFRVAGIGAPNYVGLFGRYDFDKSEALAAGGGQSFDRATIALLLGYEGGGSKVTLQAGWEQMDYQSPGPNLDDDYTFYTLTYDYRIADSTWLAVKAGSKGDRQSVTKKKDEYMLVNVRWAPDPK